MAGVKLGRVDQAALKSKASSEDWPERLVAAIHGAHPNPQEDHVMWVAECAGIGSSFQEAPVSCGPDEFEQDEAQLAQLRSRRTPFSLRLAAELEVLQLFRSLDKTTITVLADDSATERGATEKRGDATVQDIALAFGKNKKGPQ